MYDRTQMLENIERVREEIREAATVAGRDPSEITLIGVSKFFPAEYAKQAYELGLHDLGENRPEEMHEKKGILDAEDIHPRWHLIGTIQSRKVRLIIGEPYLIHSVDSLSLAQEISKRSLAKGVTSSILLEVNVSGEESKHGFSQEDIQEAFPQLLEMPNIEMGGLMTMAPIQHQSGEAERVFEQARLLFEHLRDDYQMGTTWRHLSMGMSGDFKEAIRQGSTFVRVGTAIFGKRDYPDPV